MAWFQCSCGHVSKQTPLYGEIVSVYHLHHNRRVDGTAVLVQMEPIPDRAPAAAGVEGADAHAAGPAAVTISR